VDCSAIAGREGWELCDSGFDFCAGVFNDAAGCAALCAAAGLSCAETFENAEDSCGPDTSRPALSCDADAGHQSDYCVCRGDGSGNPAASASTGGSLTSTSTSGGGMGGTGGSGDSGNSDDGASSTTSSTTGQSTTGGSVDSDACEQVNGDAITVDSTIVVESGDTFDGECRRYRAGSSLGDGSQDEGQDPVFTLEDGTRLINVVLGAPAADGIHTEGDATLQSVVWEDVGEDALTIEGTGTVVIDGGRAFDSEDKIFQINAASTCRVSSFVAQRAGKFIRQNGGTTVRVDVFIDACDISDIDESIFRTDSSSSTVSMTNTRYSDIGDALFLGVSAGNITTSNNTEY